MTYKELQTALKQFKVEGKTDIKLNSSKEVLEIEYKRVKNSKTYKEVIIERINNKKNEQTVKKSELITESTLLEEKAKERIENGTSFDDMVQTFAEIVELSVSDIRQLCCGQALMINDLKEIAKEKGISLQELKQDIRIAFDLIDIDSFLSEEDTDEIGEAAYLDLFLFEMANITREDAIAEHKLRTNQLVGYQSAD
jgi:hypothetical protein